MNDPNAVDWKGWIDAAICIVSFFLFIGWGLWKFGPKTGGKQ